MNTTSLRGSIQSKAEAISEIASLPPHSASDPPRILAGTSFARNDILKEGVSFLRRHNVPDADLSASSLLSYVLKQPRLSLQLNSAIQLTKVEEREFESLLVKRATRYPLQYLMKSLPFRNAVLEIGETCLIPRPETELLVDVAMSRLGHDLEPLHILDLGTGSGNIAISMALERPQWSFVASDFSQEALWCAQRNSVLNQVEDQIHFVCADLLNGIHNRFDAIVSNPPYLKTQDLITAQRELSFEPAMALDGGEDGLNFYRRIIEQAKQVLKVGGFIFFEIGHDQTSAITQLMSHEFESIEIIRDYAGCDRILLGRRVSHGSPTTVGGGHVNSSKVVGDG